MKKAVSSASLSVVAAMVIFGTIGIVRTYLPGVPSGLLAALRGVVGALFLLLLLYLRGTRLGVADIRRNLSRLVISGVLMGANWILLFEAYRYTSVATATLCYYMAPVFVILASPLVLRERLSARRLCCVGVALVGMVLVSGVTDVGFGGLGELRGVALGLGAALLYACVVLINQGMKDIGAYDKSIVQLAAAGVAMLPYSLVAESLSGVTLDALSVVLLAVVCFVHTGVAYALYFGALGRIPSQTVALLSYIDPVVAVLLSALLLGQIPDAAGRVGALLVLGATALGELPLGKARAKRALSFAKATPDQYEKILALYDRTIRALKSDGIEIYWDLDGHPSRAYLKEKLTRGELFVATRGKRVVGAFVADQTARPEYSEIDWQGDWRDDEVMVMHVLAVDPSERGRGVACFLLDSLEALCRERGLRAVRLDALTCNAPACALYRRAGYAMVKACIIHIPDIGPHDFEVFERVVQ